MKKPVYVTKSTLPPLEQYMAYVSDIFNSRSLTNQGVHARRLERELSAYLESPGLAVCANGTLALQLAIRHLGLNGCKVITTPFTYVATTQALLWENCEPVFADIDPHTLCLDPASVEKKLEQHPDAAGILPVHVYGNAADVEKLGGIAQSRNIKILYDAAHAFGSCLNGQSLFCYGDAVIGSFHSTKLFHTVEGGCIAVKNQAEKPALELLRAFGHKNDSHICPGINAKMSELHAAMGLALLPRITELISKRALKTRLYDDALDLAGSSLMRTIGLAPGLEWNHAYYPLIFRNEDVLNRVMGALAKDNIHPRRYFYPSLTKLPYIKSPPCPVAEDLASRVLCLPLWPDMEEDIIGRVAEIVVATAKAAS